MPSKKTTEDKLNNEMLKYYQKQNQRLLLKENREKIESQRELERQKEER